MRRIAIITARGGSKRIPKKNIRMFCGNPIITYSIRAAQSSGLFDEVMVSTDSEEIAEVAREAGAKVPFFRSDANSGDYATTVDVVAEVLKSYEEQGQSFDEAVCIYPTAPFITAEKLQRAVDRLEESGADSAVCVVRYSFPPQRGFVIRNGLTEMLHPEYMMTRSQDLEPMYHDCGQFYVLNTASFLKQHRFFMEHTVSIELPETEVQDIDNETDWIIAEMKYRMMIGQ